MSTTQNTTGMQTFTFKGRPYTVDASQEAYRVYDDVADALFGHKGSFPDEDAFYEAVDRIALRLIAKTPRREG